MLCVDEEIYPRLASNTVVMSTGTTFGHGFYGDVIEVAHKGIVIYAAKKYRHIDRKTLIKSFGSEQSLSVIRHPNLVSYCGVGALFGDQSPVVVMERMETNLGTFLEENLLGLNRKFGIIHDVVRGLNHLHSLTPPIIHGGLSEKNVLIDEKKVAKIADFGNSSVATSELTSAAQRAVLEFMPPELLEQGVCNEKVDVFSTGHLTIYVMNQHKPHPVLNSTFREKGVLKARSEVERRARYLDTMQGKLDGGSEHPLFQMVTHCLEDDADARPSCADILRSGLFTNRKFLVLSHLYIHTNTQTHNINAIVYTNFKIFLQCCLEQSLVQKRSSKQQALCLAMVHMATSWRLNTWG